MAMIAPLDLILTFERHVSSEVAMSLSTTPDACVATMSTLVARIRQLSDVSMEQVTAANEHLAIDHGKFTPEQRHKLAKLTKSVTTSDVVQGTTRAGHTMQSNKFAHKYLPARLRALLSSQELLKHKFQHTASFFTNNLGLRHPDENTKRMAVVIVLIASGLDPDPDEDYRYVREFGAIIDQKRSEIQTIQTLVDFPEDVNGFMVIYPNAYGNEDPPVACRIDEATIMERCRSDITQRRGTNSKVSRQQSSSPLVLRTGSSRVPQTPDQSINATLAGMLQQFMMSAPNGGGGDNPGLNIIYNMEQMQNRQGFSGSPVGQSNILVLDDTPRLDPSQVDRLINDGVSSPCLQPLHSTESPPGSVHDKLDALKTSIRSSSQAANEAAIKRSSKKTKDTDNEPIDEPSPKSKTKAKTPTKPKSVAKKPAAQVEEALPLELEVAKKPAAAASPPPAAKRGRRTKAECRARWAARAKAKPKSKRPQFAKKPAEHHGGKIYWIGTRNKWRVCKRKGDYLDERAPCVRGDEADGRLKFATSCAIIESDKRPIN
jgi:hypothetical protein